MALDLRVMKVGPPVKKHLLPGLLPFFVGAAFYVSSVIRLLPDIWRLPLFILLFLVSVGLAALMTLLPTIRQPEGIDRWRTAVAPALFVGGAFLFYILQSSTAVRFLTVTSVMLLLLIFVMRLDAAELTEPTRDVNSVVRFGRLLSLLGFFSVSVFLFRVDQYVSQPLLLSALVLAGLLFVMHYEALLQSGAASRLRLQATVALVALGIETFIGLSFLPTTHLANAAVLTVVVFTTCRSAVRILSGDVGTRGLKFGLLLAAVLVMLVLATAQWF